MNPAPKKEGAEQLLPCPFCGNELVAQASSRDNIAVACMECDARGPSNDFPEIGDPLPAVEQCRAAWNSRVAAEKDKLDAQRDAVRKFAISILHGDEKHRTWLLERAEEFVALSPAANSD